MTLDQLYHFLSYNPNTGVFRWLKAPAVNKQHLVGKIAGTELLGYWVIRFQGKGYKAHRLAWLFVHGRWPNDKLDHRDLNKLNNRISNLRECSAAGNTQNQAKRPGKTSKFKGVSLSPWGWKSGIEVNRKRTHIGYFSNEEAAHEAYAAKAAELHGEFARAA